ncbi:large-conductance mechanosensitive channel protein MscL [Candidatus Peregrinibacteria bacterium]|nr:large-conductance mechanosensitive channel protein MscL [Candidatus Peregrinibacteria bacterium]
MLKEFKAFAMRGNVIDLAVGVIIGGAFGKIVSSLVSDIIMPAFGIVLGSIDFTGLALHVGDASISYGKFIQAIIDFLIVAFSIFIVIQQIQRFKKKHPEADAPAAPPEEVKLLREIRDLLKK